MAAPNGPADPTERCLLLGALMIVKMMSQGWITVFRMAKVRGGYRYKEDAQRSPNNPHPSPEQLLPNEYVERSRRCTETTLRIYCFFSPQTFVVSIPIF
jgi:glutathione S-transferase